MKTSARLPVFALSLLACAPLVCARAPAGSAQRGGAVVFSVSKYEGRVTTEPVVIYRNGAYSAPPIDSEAGTKSFAGEYFRPGRRYRIISGGGEAGTLTVVKYQEPGCVGLTADATAETQARLGVRVKALATDSQTVGGGGSGEDTAEIPSRQ